MIGDKKLEPCVHQKQNAYKIAVENIIFNVKWILPLFYLGLVAMMVMYGFAYAKELVHTIQHINEYDTDQLKIIVLDFVDIVMVANLVKMIIAGSYHSFISKEHGRTNEASSSGMLKIKISTSIIIVCSIHMLKSFVTDSTPVETVYRELAIYGMFMLSAVVLGVLEFLHIKGEHLEVAKH